MALKKWLPCSATDVRKRRPCREHAKYLGVEEDDDGDGKPLLVPVCGDHTDGYDRLIEVTDADIDRFGRL